MHLKEIRVVGFKSFADPTTLTFQPGVTAIVGPNGCGKSNTADAIRWVLGEQSAKSMRAGSMQDVIFQGTSNRKPHNLCEVTLVFTDCEEQLGTAFNEVEVTRRVVRDGASGYRLNGKNCRLKDIQRLFLDTGIGQVSYSFMLQGQIDQILSSNPAERRIIFEEAAGISRYKTQRREALNKLAGVDTDLARVTDVMEEVARQSGSLKRQAAKALRYKRIKHRLTHLELAAHAFRWRELRSGITDDEAKVANLRAHSEKLKTGLEEDEGALTRQREKRQGVQERMQTAQQAVFDLRSSIESADNQANLNETRAKDFAQRIDRLADDLAKLEDEEKALLARTEEERTRKEKQQELFGDSDTVFKEQESEVREAQQKLSRAEEEVSRTRQAVLVQEGSITRLRSTATSLEVERQSGQARLTTLKDDAEVLLAEAEQLANELATLKASSEARVQEREEALAAVKARQEEAAALVSEFRTAQQELQTADREVANLRARIDSLENLQARFEGFSDGAKAVLQGKLGDALAAGDARALLPHVQVPDTHTNALETLLGAAADGVVLPDMKRAGPVAEKLAEKRLGKATLLLPMGTKDEGRRMKDEDSLPSELVAAASVVSSKDPAISNLLERLLAGCFFAPDLETVLTHWTEHPDWSFTLIATADGQLVDGRGIVFAGQSKSGGKGKSFLARANELKGLQKDLQQAQDRQEQRRLATEAVQKKINTAEQRADDAKKRRDELGQEVSTLRGQVQAAEGNRARAARAAEQKQQELARLEQKLAEAEARMAKAAHELEEAEQRLNTAKEAAIAADAAVEAARAEREARRDAFQELRVDLAEKRQRLESLDRGLRELSAQTRALAANRSRIKTERDSLTEQIGQLKVGAEEAETRAAGLRQTLEKTKQALEADRAELRTLDEALRATEERLSHRRKEASEVAEKVSSLDVDLAKRQSRAQFLEEEALREHETALEEIDWVESLWQAGDALPDRLHVDIEEESPDDPAPAEERGEMSAEDRTALENPDWNAIDDEVKTLRTRLQSIGAVNLLAIEEYRELKERHDFLKTQSDDLWEAKNQLVAAIDEINATSQQLFADTFAQIQKNFRYTFDKLFGGGKADLELVDAEDVLEAGIEITAQPPGTRLKSLQLLSGGQKTMTAVALLFAVYMVKPSPFCVLDELDAPLDDANIGRFCEMLQSFLEYSQFLIITHNKRTISIADTIYGVTMPERGVSKTFSMRFNADTGEAEKAES